MWYHLTLLETASALPLWILFKKSSMKFEKSGTPILFFLQELAAPEVEFMLFRINCITSPKCKVAAITIILLVIIIIRFAAIT